MKSATTRYICALALLGMILAGCQNNLAPQQSSEIAYQITGSDSANRGIVRITSADSEQVEWDAWLDWHDGGQSRRSVFHASIKLDKSGSITDATITRHPDEILRLTLHTDHLHCELSVGNQSARSFDIPGRGAALFIPPMSFPANSNTVLCFDPFSWDYALAQATIEDLGTTGLYAGGRRIGEIKTSGDGVDGWELPLVAVANGARTEFSPESVPAAAVIPPTLTAPDLARLSTLAVDFDLMLPPEAAWKWTGADDFVYDANTCRGEWVFSSKTTPAKTGGKSYQPEEASWGINPAQLATIQPLSVQSPRSATIPSSPLSALWRGMGDDRSRAWLAATVAQEQGWQTRIAGGLVLRPGRDFVPVITQWAEVQRDGVVTIEDADFAAGFHLRLWTAPQPLYGIDSKITVNGVQVASPASWRIIPPATSRQAWQWELSRDGALLGRMDMNWQVNLTSSRPTITIVYQGDSMNHPLAGNVTLEVDGSGHLWGYLSPGLANSPWLLLALGKGSMLCPTGNGTVAGLALYFACRDENDWLPPLLWADGQPAEVREAGEDTYSDGRELRRVHRYRVDPPGLLVSVADGGELLEVRGEFGTWHRVNLPPQRLPLQY